MEDKREIERLRLEMKSLKKDRDEWKDSAYYWESEYEKEHHEFLEHTRWENSPDEVNKLRDELRELNRRLDDINCK